ncbi:MAG TPA: cytochrome P450 [Allosphingosinicella sp.]|nr:cytochrome P450 [Allosphingosinicella sp.]
MNLLVRIARRVRRQFAPPRAPAGPLAERLDLSSPEVARHPFPHWEALRQTGAVHHLPKSGGWLVIGYEETKQALARPDIFSNAPYGEVDTVLLGEDPPRQAEIRRLVSRHFTPDALRTLEATAGRTARSLLNPELDAVTQFAQPVSRAVAAELIGFDAATLAELAAAADAAATEPLPVLIAALDAFSPRAAIYRTLLRDGEGLIGEVEARSLVRLLWLASNTTTERVIARAVLRLLEHPDVQQKVREDRALLAPFIEEVMRLHPPEHILPRLTGAEAQFGGVDIPAGAPVFLCVGAANRDPSQFPAPNELRLDRASRRHFAFGSGIHHCVGAPLARRVVAAALGALLDGAPRLRPLQPLGAEPYFSSMTALAPTRLEIGL